MRGSPENVSSAEGAPARPAAIYHRLRRIISVHPASVSGGTDPLTVTLN